MLKAIGRNTTLFGSIVIGAVVSGALAPMMMSTTGSLGPTALQAQSMPRAFVAVLLAVAVCTGLAILVGRVCNTVVGLFMLGGGLFGLAWRVGTVSDLRFEGSLGLVGIETLLFAGIVLAATVVVFRFAGPLDDVGEDESGRTPHPVLSKDALISAAAGVAVLPVVWLVAQSLFKGQALGAVFCGAMVAGLFGRLLAPNVQPILLFAAPIAFGAIGHFVAATMLVDGSLDAAFVDGAVPKFSRPMPIDYAAATLMGVAFGLGWAKSFLHHDESS